MPWPTATDYNEAIQDLRRNLADEELRAGQPALTPLGLPMIWSGGFADVYKIHAKDGNAWALKCFTRKVPGQADRYQNISTHLQRAGLPFMVDFKYIDQGVRVHGEWYPALKMRWVEGGIQLNQFVEQYLNRPRTLKLFLGLWVKTADRLRQAKMAHADLQHGNVLLVPRGERGVQLRLIDYDGMYVPAFAGSRSAELGHPAFQHPQRSRAGIYSAEVDRFSNLAIYSAIHCLTVGRQELWDRFDNSDNLLFREEDFQDPANSEVFHTLWELPDEDSRSLAGRLILACTKPLDQTPLLTEVANGRVLPLSSEGQQAVNSILGTSVPFVPAAAPAPAAEVVPDEVVPSSPLLDELFASEELPPVEMLPEALRAARPRQAGRENVILLSVLGVFVIICGLIILFGFFVYSFSGVSQPGDSLAESEPLSIEPSIVPENHTNNIGMKFNLIPAGEFLMGSPEDDPDKSSKETPQHRVRITKPYYLGVYEVTQGEYQKVMGKNPSEFKGLTRPVEQVSWEDATEFCRKLSQMDTRFNYRLPTEAEWEYACRAGTTTRYMCGDDLEPDYGWFKSNSSYQTHPVGETRPNAWGLYDMHGNVFEWCQDWYDSGYYGRSPSDDPMGSSTGRDRVLRGGSWGLNARVVRSANRFPIKPDYRSNFFGFRVALIPVAAQSLAEDAIPPMGPAVAPTSSFGTAPELSEDYTIRIGIELPQVELALRLYKTLNGELPRSHDEFMARVIEAAGITLPRLEQGERYEYDPEKGKLFVRKQVSIPAESDPPNTDTTSTDGRRSKAKTSPFSGPKPVASADLTNLIGMQFKLIPAGEFLMGSPADDPDQSSGETPQHRVRITKPYYLGVYEVTQGEYQKVMGKNPSEFKGLTRPVEQVSWEDATEFCRKLSQMDTRFNYRLPTEAEWEYACRAGTTTRYICGDDWDPDYGWFDSNSSNQTHPVGEKRPNAWGLHDMHGNVYEWCQDWYNSGYYGSSPSDDPLGASTGSIRVYRGGSWGSYPRGCRSAGRDWSAPAFRYDGLGLRVARVPAD